MHHSASHGGRSRALAPAAVLLLALCLLAVGVQAVPDPTATAALVVSGPGLYQLDHDLAPSDPVGVRINGSDVVFDGMGHSITGTGANGSIGVLVTGRFTAAEGEMIANVTVRNLTVAGWGAGVWMAEVSGTVVEDVTAGQNGVGLGISPTTGITTDHVVRDSVFRENTGSGLDLSYPAEGVTVERCAVTENGIGISAFDIAHGSANTLADCEISENVGDGLNSRDGSFAVVRNCTVSGNGDDGLEFEHGGTEIVGCHIENNAAAGAHVSDRGGSDIHGNWIEGNAIGVSDGGDWPSHVRNNVLNNTDNGFFRSNGDIGTLNYTKSAGPNIIGGPYLGGNYWTFPNGTGFSQTHPDTNGDGFCDEPYPVTEDAVDYLPLALQNGTPTPTPTPAPPFGGLPFKPLTVPGRIQAEDYNIGGEGCAYHDTTSGNSGGAYRADDVDIEVQGGTTNVGWIRNGEYLTYTANVTTAGEYTMTARVASPNSGRTIAVTTYGNGVSGAPVGTIAVPNTGSFATFREVGVPVTLVAGTHTLRLIFSGDGQNLDWIEFAPVDPTPVPNGTAPAAIPGTIQGEDYDLGGEGVAYHDTTQGNTGGAYRTDDVDIAAITDGHAVVGIAEGEYLAYTVNVTQAGSYLMTAMVASPEGNRSIALLVDGNRSNIYAVPNTGSLTSFGSTIPPIVCWDPPVGFGSCDPVPVTLAAGTHTLRLVFHGDGQSLDSIVFERAPPRATAPNGTPFTYLDIPGTIQAEDYNWGGEGTAFHDTTPGNSGGAYRTDGVDIETAGGVTNVGWIRSGEYLHYTATVAQAGTYTMSARVASPNSGRTIAVSVDGAAAGTIAVPRTGSFGAFATVSIPVTLAAGSHTVKLAFAGDGQNLDWIAFAQGPITPPTTPVPSGGASFAAAPTSAPHGSAVKFTVTPASGKTISAAWWSFDAPAHLNTWNSRAVNPTFYYPSAGTFSPLVKITYADGSTETVQRANYVKAT